MADSVDEQISDDIGELEQQVPESSMNGSDHSSNDGSDDDESNETEDDNGDDDDDNNGNEEDDNNGRYEPLSSFKARVFPAHDSPPPDFQHDPNPGPPFRFLDLLPELRVMVYSFATIRHDAFIPLELCPSRRIHISHEASFV